ncbi:hypothetical protein STEG23_019477, partial [Scotinomys teguina]
MENWRKKQSGDETSQKVLGDAGHSTWLSPDEVGILRLKQELTGLISDCASLKYISTLFAND